MEVNISDELRCRNIGPIEEHARQVNIRANSLHKRTGAEIKAGNIACSGCILSKNFGKVCKFPTITPTEAHIEDREVTPDLGDQTNIQGLRIFS